MAAGTGSLYGNGATFTLSAGVVDTIISITPGRESITVIPDDYLGVVDAHEVIPGLVATYEPITINCIADIDTLASTTVGVGATNPPALGKVVTGTLTFRPQTGQTTGATLAGTGFLVERQVSPLETDSRVTIEYVWQWDGKTGPAYTAGN